MAFSNGFAISNSTAEELNAGPVMPIFDVTFFECLEFASFVVNDYDSRVDGGLSEEGAIIEFNRNFQNCYSTKGGLLEFNN